MGTNISKQNTGKVMESACVSFLILIWIYLGFYYDELHISGCCAQLIR